MLIVFDLYGEPKQIQIIDVPRGTLSNSLSDFRQKIFEAGLRLIQLLKDVCIYIGRTITHLRSIIPQ